MIKSRQQPTIRFRVPILLLALLLLLFTSSCRANEQPSDIPAAQEDIVETTKESAGAQPDDKQPIDTTTSSNEEIATPPAKHEESHCAWGTACHPDYVDENGHANSEEPRKNGESSNTSNGNNNNNNNSNKNNSGNIPFVHHHGNHNNIVPPPEGFIIIARVYTDPNDKLAHFTDDEEGTQITLPYWECGATGSTTSPLPIKHAYFRHVLIGSKPQVWSGTEYGPHPQLVVALKRMEMTLNSGETKILKPGDVVLLEDVVSGGHKLKALEGFDMTYLLLTLPQHYHHVGRDQMALKRVTAEKRESPCADDVQPKAHGSGGGGSAFVNKQTIPKQEPLSSKSWESILTGGNSPNNGQVVPLREPKLRKLILGAFGFSVSALMADFLGKVAPLWLAVAIGGTCFVVGGTAAIVQGGDYLCSEIEMWQERKRLEIPAMDADDDKEEEEEEKGDEVRQKTAAA